MKRIQRGRLSRLGWIVILTLAVSGTYFSAQAQDATDSSSQQRVVFDSMLDGFATVNPTGLTGNASLGKIGDILGAAGIAGTFAEKNFNQAVEDGLIDPEAEALVFLTDDELVAKLKITVPHPPIIIPGAVHVKIEKVAVFKALPTGGKLRAWKRNINKILNDPALSPDQKKQALDAIKARKPKAYDRLIDDTGFEIREEETIVIIPAGVIFSEWMIEFEFRTPAFSGMGEALTRIVVEDLLPENFPNGFTADALSEAFPDADIYDFGTDNGDPEFPPNTLNFEFVDVLEDRPDSLVFDSDIDGFGVATPEGLEGDASVGMIGDILSAPGITGSFAEHAFQQAVDLGLFDPLAEALVVQTDDQLNAKIKITVPHPPIIVPGAVHITTKKVATFKSLPTGGKLRAWKRNINKILNDPSLSPDDQRRALQAIRDRKPRAYDQLVDRTGFEIREEQVIVIIPAGIIFSQWMIEFEFQTPAFLGMGEALSRIVVEDLQPTDFPNGLNADSLSAAFPDADIFDLGTDNGDADAPTPSLNFTFVDMLEDPTSALPDLSGDFGKFKVKQQDAGQKVVIKPMVNNLSDATAAGPFEVMAFLSLDDILDPGDINLGSFAMDKLNAGGTKDPSKKRKINGKGFENLVGMYVFLAFDPHNVVPEINEDNNLVGRFILPEDVVNPGEFQPQDLVTLTVEKAGSGSGTVLEGDTSPIEGSPRIACGLNCSVAFPVGTMVTLEAIPDTGSTFVMWEGVDSEICGPNPTCKVVMEFTGSITAVFDAAPPPSSETRQIQIEFAGMGDAVVTSSDGQIKCDPFGVFVNCLAAFSVTQQLVITVAVTVGYLLNGFLSAFCQVSGNQCILTPEVLQALVANEVHKVIVELSMAP